MIEQLKTLLRLWKIVKPFHKWFYLQFGIIIAGQGFIVLTQVLSSKVMDSLVKKDVHMIVLLLSLTLATEVFRTMMGYIQMMNYNGNLGKKLDQHIQEYSFSRILNLTIEQHTEEHSALKLSIINQGENNITSIIQTIAYTIIPTVALLIISLTTLVFHSPVIALIILAFFITLIAWSYLFQKTQYSYISKNRDNWNEQSKTRSEAFQHLGLVKTLARESQFIATYLNNQATLFPHHLITQKRANKSTLRRDSFEDLCSVAITALAVYFYFKGAFTLGAIYLILGLTTRIFNSAGSLTWAMREIPQSFIHIEKYLDIIDKVPNFREGGEKDFPLDGDIIFSNVSFKYPKSEGPVLNDCTFTIPAGKTTAFVGHSGSGKSTIARLLLRSYDYQSGHISMSGHELRNIDAHYIREHTGYVEQHVDLFDDTVRNNILIATRDDQRDAKNAQLDDIGEKTRISEFYHRLGEKKWDALVGERGTKLSGGERQRVGIARAIVKDPEILIFDEATASLDSVNEKYVMDAIAEVSKGKTSIIIAHRLSTIRNADNIIVMDKGQVVATGTHDELMKSSSQYQDLVQHQMHEA